MLDPELTVVVFRRTGWGPDEYRSWSDAMLREQRVFVLPTTYHGELMLRAVYLHPECGPEITDEIIASLA